jgi:hypothetical protein
LAFALLECPLLQVLVVVDPAVNKETDYAAKDGVTPPMRNAALRQFKPPINAPQERMHDVFTDVMEMLNGRCVSSKSTFPFLSLLLLHGARKV